MAKSEPEDLKDWKDQITGAIEYQKRGGRLEKWKKYKRWYRNEYPSHVVSVNIVFGIGRALVPQLYFKSPQILVNPRKPQWGQQAKVLESIDSWLIKIMGFKNQIKLMIHDAYLTNIGVGKIGYHSISTELPEPSASNIPEMAELLGTNTEELTDELVRRKWSYHDYIQPDSPWYLRIRPQDVLVPWGFYDEHEAPWMAFRITRPLEDVKKDPTYKDTARLQSNAKPDHELAGVASPNLLGHVAKGEFVELFEIWDKRDGFVRVLSRDHDKWLRREEHNSAMKGVPATVLRFNPDGDDFWGVPDVEQIHKQVFELNENRTHEIETKRLVNVKGIVDTNIVDEEELQKLEKGKPGPFVRAKGNPSNAVSWTNAPVSPDFFRIDEVIRQDVREIIGQSRNQQGEYQTGRKTATEVEAVREAHMLRADERRDQVGDLIAETFRDKIHPLIFQNWTQERVILVTSMNMWAKYTGEQIRGDYEVDVIADSVLPTSRRLQQAITKELFMTFRGDPRVRQDELYRRSLAIFSEIIPNPESLLVPEEEVRANALLIALTQMQQEQANAGMPTGAPA